MTHLVYPEKYVFDEVHYVQAARVLIDLKSHANKEHPPLAKFFIGASIKIFGDHSFGWRAVSTFFGTLTIIAIYLLALALFQSQPTALFAAFITVVNNLVFVHARVAILDTFMVTFLFCSLLGLAVSLLHASSKKKSRQWLFVCGVFLGLAMACKWHATVLWITAIFFYGVFLYLKYLKFKIERVSLWNHKYKDHLDWLRPETWTHINISSFLVLMVATPAITYFLTFVPLLFLEGRPYGIVDLFKVQREAWGMIKNTNDLFHPYVSLWWQWPLMQRPIWYFFGYDDPEKKFIRGILCIGNPLIMWSGLVAYGVCVWAWLKHQSFSAFFIVATYSILYFSWGIIPRRYGFYYYYYPAGVVLSLALAFCFHHYDFTPVIKIKKYILRPHVLKLAYWLMALGFFVYFYPILAGLKIKHSEYLGLMWFKGWI